jgi:hypothetical protein
VRPVRTDRPADILERTIDKFTHQKPRMIDRPRHGGAALQDPFEACAAVIGLITDQQHKAMALRRRILQGTLKQRTADAAIAERRLDGQRPSNSAGVLPTQTGNCRTEPTISVPIRAVNDRSSR